MGRRRRLEQRLRTLGEIRDILGAMKNLALIETRKLARVLTTEQRPLATLRAAAADFARSHPWRLSAEAPGRSVCLLVGSERGFCGDFNERLLRALAAQAPGAALIVAGHRLAARMAHEPGVIATLPGAASLEDVPDVLLGVMHALDRWQAKERSEDGLRLAVLHHVEERVERTLLDPFASGAVAPPAGVEPPLLYLPPRVIFAELLDQYVFVALHDIFYRSLAAENQRRVQHMDAAVRRLDQKVEQLARRGRILRQEEITEEIEVILLSGVPENG